MKKILTVLTFACFMVMTEQAVAQEKISSKTVTTAEKDPMFASHLVAIDDKTQVMTFTGHVSFKSDKFELTDAGKVVYDMKTKKLVIYDCKGFFIDGKVVVSENASKAKTVEFTLGEDTVYMF